MDRRSFIRSMFLAGGAIVTGAALLPGDARAASLLETLQDMDKKIPATPEADLPVAGGQEVQFRRRARRRVCVTRVGPRGRVRRVCRFG